MNSSVSPLFRHADGLAGRNSGIERLCRLIANRDYHFLPGGEVRALLEQQQLAPADWAAFRDSWNRLALDSYMADGGRYRRRRHATLSAPAGSGEWRREPHQPHYQGLDYNSLNGGIARHYEPIEDGVLLGSTMEGLLTLGCRIFSQLAPYWCWHIEAHQFRIEASERTFGKPTPEGVHRDGVNYVMMVMVNRHNMSEGVSTIHDLDKRPIEDFTLSDALDMAIVNDEHVYHGVTPIMPLDPAEPALRDILVLTFRRSV